MRKRIDDILRLRQQLPDDPQAYMTAYSTATKDAEQDMLYSRREQIEDQDIERDSQVSQVAEDFSATPLYYRSTRLQQQDLQLPSKDANRRKRRLSSQGTSSHESPLPFHYMPIANTKLTCYH